MALVNPFSLRCQALIDKAPDYQYMKTYKRHLRDITELDKEEYYFDEKLGTLYVTVIESFTHSKGSLAGQPFLLQEWQKLLIIIALGWQKKNKGNVSNQIWLRRFSTILIFLARKNGKTIISAGIAIADALIRNSGGSEIIAGATKREQAMLVVNEMWEMISKHRDLRKLYRKVGNKIFSKVDNSTIYSLGRDSKNEDGLNSSIGIIDEYHAHPSSDIFDIIKSSMGSRAEPLMVVISTAGFSLASPLVQEVEYSRDVLDKKIVDENYFAFIAEPNQGDDPFSIESLKKSNPNIGISISEEFLIDEMNISQTRPEKLVNFMTKHLNKFVNASESFLKLEDWQAGALDISEVDLSKAIKCYIGVDLSVSGDLSAVVNMYQFEDDSVYLTSQFWLPDKTMEEQQTKYRVPFKDWIESDYITPTVGDYIDYDIIYKYIRDKIEENEAIGIETLVYYDAYKFRGIRSSLENEAGFTEAFPVAQGFLTLSEPITLLKTYTQNSKLKHSDNPILNWNFSNVEIQYDSYGNIKFDKSSKFRKIDGASATSNCFFGLLQNLQEGETVTDIQFI